MNAIGINERGQVTARVSPGGVRDEFEHYPQGSPKAGFLFRHRRDVFGANEWSEFDYDAAGHLVSVRSSWTDELRFVPNAFGKPEEIRLPGVAGGPPAITRLRYDPLLNVKSVERPRGSFVDGTLTGDFIRDLWTYDGLGHLEAVVLGANTASPRRWSYVRDHDGQALREIDPAGSNTARCFDERGLVLEETQAWGTPAAETRRWEYDRVGRVRRIVAPGERSTTTEYDSWGRPAHIALPNGSVVHQEWGALDVLLRRWVTGDPGDGAPPRALSRTEFDSDERGRAFRVRRRAFADNPEAFTELWETRWLDADDRLQAVDGPRGQRWTFAWDGLGRAIGSQDPMGNATVVERFPVERRVRETATHLGTAQSLVIWVDTFLDARGRAIRKEDDQGRSTATEYDDRDLPVRATLTDGTEVLRSFGLLGERAAETVDPGGLGLVSSWSHDRMGRVLAFVDPTGERTTWLRDPLGRVTRLTLPDGGAYATTHGPGGEVVGTTRPSGAAVLMERDGAGRIVRVAATPGPGQIAMPDQTFRWDGLDRIVRAAAGTDIVALAWDSLGRLGREERSGRAFVALRDDLAGWESVTFPDGRVERIDFDLLGRPSSATLVSTGSSGLGMPGRASDGMLAGLSWLGPNRIERVEYGHGGVSQRAFDAAGRLLGVEYRDPGDAVLDSVALLHDVRDRRRVVQRTGAAPDTGLFGYDARGRLTRTDSGLDAPTLAGEPGQAVQDAAVASIEALQASAQETDLWTLDGADTRTSAVTTGPGGSATTAYVQSAGHRVDQAGATALGYDADGNRVSDGTRTVVFDALGRAREVRDAATGALLAALDYDPLGRIGREVDGTTERWRYHMGGRCLWEEDGAGLPATVRSYLPGMRLPIGEGTAAGAWTWHLGPHEDLLLAVDQAGQAAEAYRYSAFGAPEILDPETGAVRPGSAIGQRPIWGGIPWLAGAGLGRTPARLYDPVLGMWLSRDPLGYVDSPNLWAFAGHEPMGRVDPSGMGATEAMVESEQRGSAMERAGVQFLFDRHGIGHSLVVVGRFLFQKVTRRSWEPGGPLEAEVREALDIPEGVWIRDREVPEHFQVLDDKLTGGAAVAREFFSGGRAGDVPGKIVVNVLPADPGARERELDRLLNLGAYDIRYDLSLPNSSAPRSGTDWADISGPIEKLLVSEGLDANQVRDALAKLQVVNNLVPPAWGGGRPDTVVLRLPTVFKYLSRQCSTFARPLAVEALQPYRPAVAAALDAAPSVFPPQLEAAVRLLPEGTVTRHEGKQQ